MEPAWQCRHARDREGEAAMSEEQQVVTKTRAEHAQLISAALASQRVVPSLHIPLCFPDTEQPSARLV
jgi:hypothetical protein